MKNSLMIKKRDFSQLVKVGNYYKVNFATKWARGTVIFKLNAIDDHLKSTTYLFAEDSRVLELQTGKVKSTYSTCDNFNGAVVKVTNIQHIEEATMEESRALRTYFLNKEMEAEQKDEAKHFNLLAERQNIVEMQNQYLPVF